MAGLCPVRPVTVELADPPHKIICVLIKRLHLALEWPRSVVPEKN
jgi:hypothetical protein